MVGVGLSKGGVGADLVGVGGVVLGLEGGQGAAGTLGGRGRVQVGARQFRVAGVVVLARTALAVQALPRSEGGRRVGVWVLWILFFFS